MGRFYGGARAGQAHGHDSGRGEGERRRDGLDVVDWLSAARVEPGRGRVGSFEKNWGRGQCGGGTETRLLADWGGMAIARSGTAGLRRRGGEPLRAADLWAWEAASGFFGIEKIFALGSGWFFGQLRRCLLLAVLTQEGRRRGAGGRGITGGTAWKAVLCWWGGLGGGPIESIPGSFTRTTPDWILFSAPVGPRLLKLQKPEGKSTAVEERLGRELF